VGKTSIATELTQNLARLGKKITLVVQQSNIFQVKYISIIKLLQGQLEVEDLQRLS
jgi:pyruvate/2-oxoglutarate dehydrogenase complex dihydrolipoamide dehydrogenase (E3) component